MNNEKIIIIGGGAAGLCAAIVLGRAGKKVLLLEQNTKVGKKILASGNGKCNITNKYMNMVGYSVYSNNFLSFFLNDSSYIFI